MLRLALDRTKQTVQVRTLQAQQRVQVHPTGEHSEIRAARPRQEEEKWLTLKDDVEQQQAEKMPVGGGRRERMKTGRLHDAKRLNRRAMQTAEDLQPQAQKYHHAA